MDALSDVLRAVRLTGAVFFDVHASTPWVAETPTGDAIVSTIFPGAEHLIPYHVITEGSCYGGLLDAPPILLSAGDIIVFPHGDAHVMSSAPGMRSEPDLGRFIAAGSGQRPFAMNVGGAESDPGHLVCGFLGCDARPFNPLLAALPRVLHVKPRAGAFSAFVQFAVAEASEPRPGSECVLGRLSEMMFVDVVRQYIEGLPPGSTDWLSALRDPSVGRALTTLHHDPVRAWTLEALAREVGVSRSTLAERFTQFVGQPPMQYLANWRMQLAANHLQSGTDNVATIAERVGYESEAAFSRAFKKAVGTAPSAWRRQRVSARPLAHAASA